MLAKSKNDMTINQLNMAYRHFYGFLSSSIGLERLITTRSQRISMTPTLKPCSSCEKQYDVKLLRDGVCDKCLATLVIRQWLNTDKVK